MNNLININKITTILKSSQYDSLDYEIRQAYTPCLWGNKLVPRASFEGRITDIIRWIPALDQSKKCWKHIIREAFSKLNDQDISFYSTKEQNKLFTLKYKYTKKNKSFSSDKSSPSFSNPLLQNTDQKKTEDTTQVHWTKNPDQLKQLSLLRMWTVDQNLGINTSVLDALYGFNKQNFFNNSEFFNSFSDYILQTLKKNWLFGGLRGEF